MPKTIMIYGAPHVVAPNQSVENELKNSGGNFGNLLIGKSVRDILNINELITKSSISSPEEANERCDHVVIPAANFLWKGFDFGHMADFLEKTNLPITIIGVGAQSSNRAMIGSIHPGTLRLMKLISERSELIGVRGYYTAEVLSTYGIHNVEAIGCPSLYSKSSKVLKINTGKLQNIEGLSINFSRRVASHSFEPETMKMVENQLLKFAISRNGTFVAQDEKEELLIARKGLPNEQVSKYFNGSPRDVVNMFFRDNTRYFINITDWEKYIITKPFSIGTRLHGNLIALINGTPSLLIAHDSRTMEVANLWRMPSIHVSSLAGNDNINFENIINNINYKAFEDSYKFMFKRFSYFLDRNLLENNLEGP